MKWETEEEFERAYYKLTDPREQLTALQNWRRYQLKVVPKFVGQIRLLANEQYSQIDHFLLELIQNADDNDYPEGVVPKVRIQLQADRLVLQNNEVGFRAENVFAITYAAASTKIRKKHAATFIGEKGIGFKSVFAVAERVEIHSGPYHFALHDNEYIVPHLLSGQPEGGTRIVLHFKASVPDVAQKLSRRLQNLAEGPQEFLLFLRQLRKLTIADEQADVFRTMRVVEPRDRSAHSVLIRPGYRKAYRKVTELRSIPASVVTTRFSDLKADLEREVVLAVPIPALDTQEIKADGRLFCFLPTRVRTGLPIHLQSDAKTTTNRENIQDFGSSRWNEELFSNLADRFLETYKVLAEDPAFRDHLPAYWPISVSEETIGNADLAGILDEVKERLRSEPMVLDWHGSFKEPASVRLVPTGWAKWLSEEKYEMAINAGNAESNGVVTLVAPHWAAHHRDALVELGVQELGVDELIAALSAGTPETVKTADDSRQRDFLTAVVKLGESAPHKTSQLRKCAIFPLRHGNRRVWSSFKGTVFWMQSDTANVTTSGDTVDPRFTYTLGGTEGRTPEGQKTRQFNTRFRRFLADTLDVPVFSQVEYLRRTSVKELRSLEFDPNVRKQRHRVNELWQQVFLRGWRRQTTIIRENGQDAFDGLMEDLQGAKIPARPAGEQGWILVEVDDGFLGRPFVSGSGLDQAYVGTGAPVVQLDLLPAARRRRGKKRKKTKGPDWVQWGEFLGALRANTGPYFVEGDLVGSDGLHSYQSIGGESKAWPNLKRAIDQAVSSEVEFSSDRVSTFRLEEHTRSLSLDSFSLNALKREDSHEFIGRRAGAVWGETENRRTQIRFTWGQKYRSRFAETPYLWIYDQLKYNLKLQTTLGLRWARDCFQNTTFNQAVLGTLVPLVEVGRNGYAEEMLCDLGVRADADIDDFGSLIQAWFSATASEERQAEVFVPWIRALIKYLEFHPEHSVSVQVRVQFFDPVQDQLVGMRDWLESTACVKFEEELVARLRTLLGEDTKRDAPELVGELFNIGEFSVNEEAVCRAFMEIGRRVAARPDPEVFGVFRDRLSMEGVCLNGEKITTEDLLPLVWTTHPVPSTSDGVLVLKPTLEQRPFVEAALRFLGWPSTATATVRVVNEEQSKPIGDLSARRLDFCLAEIVERLGDERPEIAAKIRKSGLVRTTADHSPAVFTSPDLKVDITDQKASTCTSIAYWFADGRLFLDGGVPLAKAIPLFLDRETGSTIAPFFDLLWAGSEAAVHVESGTRDEGKGDHEPPDHPDKREGQNGGDEGGNKSDLEDDIFDDGTDGETDDVDDGKSDDDDDRNKGDGGPRRRLCSYVIGEGRGKKGETGQSGGSGSDSDDAEVEAAGRRRMVDYFEKAGARVESKESEKVGYDFEVTIGGKMIYVELKSSKDRWQGWEHGLTRNEFAKALELGDDFYLCTVDRVFQDDYVMRFIRDPARSVDLYLFDHPWKAVGLDMNTFIQRLKDAEGLVEDE